MLLSLRKSIPAEEFDYVLLKHALCRYKNPRVKINDLLKKGHIIRVKKGLYVFGPQLSKSPCVKETLANLIYGPSYISLEYALSFYGLIPERVETVTSITNKRNKIFHTPVGAFSYRYINPSIYACGITLYKMDDYHTVLIASKEKAVSDMLYFLKEMPDGARVKNYLLDDLRMERGAFKKFNKKTVKKLAGLYGRNVDLFYNVLMGETK
ncbi:MAG: hypothetical protein JW847_10110 [Candidatus Omnitrophica bacterium]|nr:hypothetical protein [Candidatus Omnitrophota bacterium]